MGKKTLSEALSVDNSLCSSIHTLLKSIEDLLSKVKPIGHFILLDFGQFSSMFVLNNQALYRPL